MERHFEQYFKMLHSLEHHVMCNLLRFVIQPTSRVSPLNGVWVTKNVQPLQYLVSITERSWLFLIVILRPSFISNCRGCEGRVGDTLSIKWLLINVLFYCFTLLYVRIGRCYPLATTQNSSWQISLWPGEDPTRKRLTGKNLLLGGTTPLTWHACECMDVEFH